VVGVGSDEAETFVETGQSRQANQVQRARCPREQLFDNRSGDPPAPELFLDGYRGELDRSFTVRLELPATDKLFPPIFRDKEVLPTQAKGVDADLPDQSPYSGSVPAGGPCDRVVVHFRCALITGIISRPGDPIIVGAATDCDDSVSISTVLKTLRRPRFDLRDTCVNLQRYAILYVQGEAMFRLTVRSGSEVQIVEAAAGETILSVLQRATALDFDAPCGGNGTCGKCLVTLSGGICSPDATERSLLGSGFVPAGQRLACRARVTGDCEVRLPQSTDAVGSGSDMTGSVLPYDDPVVRVLEISLDAPSLADQSDLTRRIAAALGVAEAMIPMSIRRRLPADAADGPLHVAFTDQGLIDLRRGTEWRSFGVGVDIGTSTVVVYLIDLRTGELLASRSELNAQKALGADVISRISYASRGPDEVRILQRRIVDQVQRLTEELARSEGESEDDVLLLLAAGNTTMLHLFAGVSPEAIAAAPFAPVFTDQVSFAASDIGLRFHENAEVRLLPSAAGYVGADILAGVVATSLDRAVKPALLIDLGTNCEIVLANDGRMLACATAAGPAFEGAQIECGMGGVSGAIRRVWWDEGIRIETVGADSPVGICGSGILDVMALLLELGLVDETGRLEDDAESSPRFILVAGGSDADGRARREVYFSQRDIREVQLAKAAVAAGVEVLADRIGVKVDEIDRVYLSGAFGSAMSPVSACAIGMLPAALRDRVEAVGNSAGRGVYLALRSRSELGRCMEVRNRVEYVELSSDTAFRDAYIEHMGFPSQRAPRLGDFSVGAEEK